MIHSIVHDEQSSNYVNSGHTPFNNENQYLQETISTTLSLQGSLLVVIHEDILKHLHNDISTVVHVLQSLLTYLRNKVLQSSLLTFLQNIFILLSVLIFLQSTPVHTSTLSSLWNIFLRRLYEDVYTIICIQVKPKIHSYNHLYEDISIVTPIHMKPEISKSWIPSRSLLQPYIKYFHKLITHYIIDYNHNNDTDNIRRKVVGYIMSLKRNEKRNSRHATLRRINIISCSTMCYRLILIFCGLILARDIVC